MAKRPFLGKPSLDLDLLLDKLDLFRNLCLVKISQKRHVQALHDSKSLFGSPCLGGWPNQKFL